MELEYRGYKFSVQCWQLLRPWGQGGDSELLWPWTMEESERAPLAPGPWGELTALWPWGHSSGTEGAPPKAINFLFPRLPLASSKGIKQPEQIMASLKGSSSWVRLMEAVSPLTWQLCIIKITIIRKLSRRQLLSDKVWSLYERSVCAEGSTSMWKKENKAVCSDWLER